MAEMFLEILIAIIFGCLMGVITGITPGLHINLVALILLSISPILLGYTNIIAVASFIIAMSITHTFTDLISAIYLGAPADDTALAVLPGHRMLLEGMGYEAVKLTTIGSLFGLIAVILISPFLIIIIPSLFNLIKPLIGWILLAVVVFMILRDKDSNKKFWNVYTFVLSGILGILVFSFPNIKDPLLPLLSGMFGISMLAMSLSQKVILPLQRTTESVIVKGKELFKSVGSSVFSGSLVSIFPGLGPAQAAVLGTQIAGRISTFGFLILVGGINTVSMVISIITMFSISKARNGSIAVVQKLIGSIDIQTLVLFICVALIAGGTATFLTLYTARIFSRIMNKINYSIASISIIIFISLLVFYFSGFIGLFVLIISTFIGLIPAITNVNRSNLMGCLLLPVIIYYLI